MRVDAEKRGSRLTTHVVSGGLLSDPPSVAAMSSLPPHGAWRCAFLTERGTIEKHGTREQKDDPLHDALGWVGGWRLKLAGRKA